MPNTSIASMVAAARAASASAGSTRVVLIDGPAGSGKTTLANRLGAALGALVLHGDDMYEGWSGLATLDTVLIDQVLEPLASGKPAGFQRWDWVAGERAKRIDVPAASALVIEGVGVAQRRARAYASLVVFVDAPWPTRLERGLDRDGEAMRGEWERWELTQNEHLVNEGTREAADAVIDGTLPVGN